MWGDLFFTNQSINQCTKCTTNAFSMYLNWNYTTTRKKSTTKNTSNTSPHQKKIPKQAKKSTTQTKSTTKLKNPTKKKSRRNGKCSLIGVLGELSPLNVTGGGTDRFLSSPKNDYLSSIIAWWESPSLLVSPGTPCTAPWDQPRNLDCVSFRLIIFHVGKKVETCKKVSDPWR